MHAMIDYLPTLFLAGLSTVANWLPCYQDGARPKWMLWKRLNSRGWVVFVLILCTTGFLLWSNERERDADRVVIVQLRQKLDSADSDLSRLRENIDALYAASARLEIWRRRAENTFELIELTSAQESATLESAVVAVEFASERLKLAPTDEAARLYACAIARDFVGALDRYGERWEAQCAAIDAATVELRIGAGMPKLQEYARATSKNMSPFLKSVGECPEGVEPKVARLSVSDAKATSHAYFSLFRLAISAEYARRINELLPANERINVPTIDWASMLPPPAVAASNATLSSAK